MGFVSDFATVTAIGGDISFPVTRVQSFEDMEMGDEFRSVGTAGIEIEWDFGAPVSTDWCHLAGLRGLVGESYFTAGTKVEFLEGASSPAPTLVGNFEAAPLNGDLWITHDTITSRYRRVRFNGVTDGSALGYIEVARAACGAFTTLGTNFLKGFRISPIPESTVLRNSRKAPIPRFIEPSQTTEVRWGLVLKDAADLAAWRKIVSWGMPALGYLDPLVPGYYAPDPAGEVMGATEDWMGPRFAWISKMTRPTDNKEAMDNLFAMDLTLETVRS